MKEKLEMAFASPLAFFLVKFSVFRYMFTASLSMIEVIDVSSLSAV